MQKIDEERKVELENHHFATIIIIIDSGQNHQWILKLVGKSLMRDRIFIVSKHVPKKFINSH